MKRSLCLSVSLFFFALAGCEATLGPGEAWYVYRNPQNSFAVVAIDGRPRGHKLRPYEEGEYPLSISQAHTVIVSHGAYKSVIGADDGRQAWEADVIDPPFTIRWVDEAKTWRTVAP